MVTRTAGRRIIVKKVDYTFALERLRWFCREIVNQWRDPVNPISF